MSVSHLFVVLVLVVLFLFVVVTVWNSSKCTDLNYYTTWNCFICVFNSKCWWEKARGKSGNEHGTSSASALLQATVSNPQASPVAVATRLIIQQCTLAICLLYMPFLSFFSQWIGWIMSCVTEREYLIGTWHLTLAQIDVREFCCLFDLPLMFSEKSCQTWKFRYAQICQVKNLHDGRGPSKVLKSCHLALFISLRLGIPDDELVEDPIFVSMRKIL